MGLIRDTLNVKIFVLIVLVVVAMVSLLVVFQRNFEDINVKYKEKVHELNTTFANLTGAQTQLNKTLSDLELKNLRETDLREQYTKLKADRDSLQDEVNKLNGVIAEKDKKITSLNNKIIILESDIEKLERKISKLEKRIDCFESGSTNC
ncbi:hypothetical protein HYU23_02985 [Candidatus Woesearchaeota archaeon]|nr:hypothetical protein [Candidatus Woesearchaeota archaeon]